MRIKILGPCLAVAMLALVGTTAAASASLAPPVWAACEKAAKEEVKWTESGKEKHKSVYTGEYEEKACAKRQAPNPGPIREKGTNPGPEGKYSLVDGIGRGKSLKGKTSKEEDVVLHVKSFLGDQTVTCASASASASPLVPNREANLQIVFKKCALFGEKECRNGEKSGEITTPPGLEGHLGYVKEGAEPEVGLWVENPQLKEESEEHKPMVTFSCYTKQAGKPEADEVNAEVNGDLIGVVGGDVNVVTKESTLLEETTERYGLHEFEGKPYKPSVNILGFASEVAEIEEAELANEEERAPAHVLKGNYCGPFVHAVLGAECTPPTYTGLDMKLSNKGEALMIKAEE